MPRNAEDVESFLLDLNRTFDRTDGDLFIVSSGAEGPPIFVSVADPVVAVRVDIGKIPENQDTQREVFRMLLELNQSLLYAGYAIDGDHIVLTAGLELKSLDANEIAAVLSDIDLALARHVGKLRERAVAKPTSAD